MTMPENEWLDTCTEKIAELPYFEAKDALREILAESVSRERARLRKEVEGMKENKVFTTPFFGDGLSLMQGQRNAALDSVLKLLD